jgi:hypothetical protein
VIQIDICPEELGPTSSQQRYIGLFGDIQTTMTVFVEEWKKQRIPPVDTQGLWWTQLRTKIAENKAIIGKLWSSNQIPMNYYRALYEVKSLLPDNFLLVNEGANTMVR